MARSRGIRSANVGSDERLDTEIVAAEGPQTIGRRRIIPRDIRMIVVE